MIRICSTAISASTATIGEKIERPDPERQDPPPEPQIGLARVVEEALDRPKRVRQLHPGREDVREDRQDVNVEEDVHEQLDFA